MTRAPILPRPLRGERYFRWRGGDVSRLEGLADAAFAFALTLLVVSLEVPASFAELERVFTQVPAFAVCFAILVMCWFFHYQFHRRFGLEDGPTIVLDAVLLFLILVYVYPLKFVFTLLFDRWLGAPIAVPGPDGAPVAAIGPGEGTTLMTLYGAGFASIFLLFALQYVHALRHADALGLDARERAVARITLRSHWISVAFGAVSVAIARLVPEALALSGWIYFGLGPAQGLHGWLSGRRVERAHAPFAADG